MKFLCFFALFFKWIKDVKKVKNNKLIIKRWKRWFIIYMKQIKEQENVFYTNIGQYDINLRYNNIFQTHGDHGKVQKLKISFTVRVKHFFSVLI